MRRFGCGLLVVFLGCTVNGKAFGPSLSTSTSSSSASGEDPSREAEKRAAAEREAEKQRESDKEDAARERSFAKYEAERAAAKKKQQDDDAAYEEFKAYCDKIKPVSDAANRDNANTQVWAWIAGCRSANKPTFWFLEQKAETSQVWHLAATLVCYGNLADQTNFKPVPADELKNSSQLMRFAFCRYDGQQLDKAKFEAEVKANRDVTPRVKGWMLATFDRAKAFVDAHTAAYKALAKDSPVVQDVVFTAPEAAFKQWTETYAKLKPDFDVVIDVERRADTSKSALKGCAAKLRPAFFKLVTERKPKDKNEYDDLKKDPFVSRLIRALSFCEMIDGDEVTGALLAQQLVDERGPREAAAKAAFAKIVEARADNPKFSTEPRMFEFPQFGGNSLEVKNRILSTDPGGGTVAKVEPKDGRLAITFKSTSWMEDRYDCKDTKQIDRIDNDGRIVYRQNCRPAGKEKVTFNERGVTVPAAYGSAIKPGQFLMFVRKRNDRNGYYDDDEPLWGALPLFSFSDTKKTKLVSVLGQPL